MTNLPRKWGEVPLSPLTKRQSGSGGARRPRLASFRFGRAALICYMISAGLMLILFLLMNGCSYVEPFTVPGEVPPADLVASTFHSQTASVVFVDKVGNVQVQEATITFPDVGIEPVGTIWVIDNRGDVSVTDALMFAATIADRDVNTLVEMILNLAAQGKVVYVKPEKSL